MSLKLELKSDKKVLVTNLQTNEQKEVTLGFLQQITSDALLMLVQYKYYELLIHAERVWQQVQQFNPEAEAIKEIYLEEKFRNIMVNDSWLKITEYDWEMYNKALAWVEQYDPKSKIDKSAMIAAGSGAIVGAAASSTIGGVGVAVGGTAFGVGMLGLATLGTLAGLAAYGIGKAFD
jgi:hypothetical protein